MIYHKKIKAFTLTEIMIVMVITAIVVGLAMSILSIIQKQSNALQQLYFTNNKVVLLNQELTLYFHRFHHITWNESEGLLDFKTPIDQKQIDLSESADIHSLIKEKYFYLEGEEVASGAIDAVKLVVNVKEKEQVLFVYKRKDVATLLNNGD